MKLKESSDSRFTGRVVDQRTGAGLDGLRVELWHLEGAEPLEVTETDSNGFFTLLTAGTDLPLQLVEGAPALVLRIRRGSLLLLSSDHGLSQRIHEEGGILTIPLAEMADAVAATLLPANRPPSGEVGLPRHEEPAPASVSGTAPKEPVFSQTAYLVDLLEYALSHVKNGGQPISLPFLQEQFHQPFGNLKETNPLAHTELKQVRICVEALRSYLAANPPTEERKRQLQRDHAAYLLAAYTTLLTRLGTSYEELRVARGSDDTFREALADRLGISPGYLDNLLLEPGSPATTIGPDHDEENGNTTAGVLSEKQVEQLVGLLDSTRTPLTEPPVPSLQTWQKEHLRRLWQKQELPGGRPVIDPDLLCKEDFQQAAEGNAAYELWEKRRTWVGEQVRMLAELRRNSTRPEAAFAAMVDKALGVSVKRLREVDAKRRQGQSIEQDLRDLNLTPEGLTHLSRFDAIVGRPSGVLESEWAEVQAALVQVMKRKQFPTWRHDEKADKIDLTPDWFTVSDKLQPADLPAWLASWTDRIDWVDRLRARTDQEQSIIAALQAAVGVTEELTLPLLRDALIRATNEEGSLEEKAARITDRLGIDMRAAGSLTTTRLGQVLDTLQSILFAIRTGQLHGSHTGLTLDRDHFDAEWEWIGSYNTWCSAISVFVYPENLLQPSLRKWQSPAIRNLMESLRMYRRLTPRQARAMAGEYLDYLRDITSLTLEASCQAWTRTANLLNPSDPGYRSLFFAFGRGAQSGKVYWSAFDPTDTSGYPQTPWEAVPGLAGVTSVIGSATYGPGLPKSAYAPYENLLPPNIARSGSAGTADGFKQLGNAVLSVDRSISFTGTTSVKVVTTAAADQGAAVLVKDGASDHKSYVVTVRLRGTGTVRLAARYGDSPASSLGESDPIRLTNQWQAVTLSFAARPNLRSGNPLQLSVRSVQAQEIAFWMDGWLLTEMATPHLPVEFPVATAQGHIYLFAIGEEKEKQRLQLARYDLEHRAWEQESVELEMPAEKCTVVIQQHSGLGTPPTLAFHTPRGDIVTRQVQPDGSGWAGNAFRRLVPESAGVRDLLALVESPTEDAFLFATDRAGAIKYRLSKSSEPAICSRQDGTLDLFIRNDKNEILHRSRRQSSWTDWATLTHKALSAPAATSWKKDTIHLFWQEPGNQVKAVVCQGTSWGGIYDMEIDAIGNPAAASTPTPKFDVVVRRSDNAVWHRRWSSGDWGTKWTSLGGALSSDPAVAIPKDDLVYVFGRGTDNRLWYISGNPARWDTWQCLGGTLSSSPAACTEPNTNRVHVFVRGTDHALWHRYGDGTAWSLWGSLGGTLTSAPAAAWVGPDELIVTAAGPDGAVWQRSRINGVWHDWEPIPDTSLPSGMSDTWHDLGTEPALAEGYSGTVAMTTVLPGELVALAATPPPNPVLQARVIGSWGGWKRAEQHQACVRVVSAAAWRDRVFFVMEEGENKASLAHLKDDHLSWQRDAAFTLQNMTCPVVAIRSNGAIDLFAVMEGKLHQAEVRGGKPGKFTPLPMPTPEAAIRDGGDPEMLPGVCFAPKTGDYEIFTLGRDNAVWHGSLYARTWTSLGGNWTSAPAVCAREDRIDLFVRGQEGALWHRFCKGSDWSDWRPVGGILLTSRPAATARGLDQVEVLARGSDGNLWHSTLTNETWSAWTNLEGATPRNRGGQPIPQGKVTWVGTVTSPRDGRLFALWRRGESERYTPIGGSGKLPVLTLGLTGIKRMAPHCGWNPAARDLLVAYQAQGGQTGLFRTSLRCTGDQLFTEASARMAPRLDVPFTLTERLSQGQLQARRKMMAETYAANSPADASTLDYLNELFYSVPIQLGLHLSTSGQHVAALDWFRTIYDYSLPRTRLAERKIYYGLTREENLRPKPRPAEWLLDPLNPHTVAASRKSAYTRFTLLSLAQTLLDFADAEFARDTSESLPQARTLYASALELLDLNELREPSVTPDMLGRELARFAIPPNPVWHSLRLQAGLNLQKLRQGRNIAGLERPPAVTEPTESGQPVAIPSQGGRLSARAPGSTNPTPYRYSALIDRAKQLVHLAAQMESSMLMALEKRDAEYYNLLKARQDLSMTRAGVKLQELRLVEAHDGVTGAQLEQSRAQLQATYYRNLLDEGYSDLEIASLADYRASINLQYWMASVSFLAAALPAGISAGYPPHASVTMSPQGAALAVAQGLGALAGAHGTAASMLGTIASYERRAQEWTFMQSLAQQDVRIGANRIKRSEDQVRIAEQERSIAALHAEHASATLEFLARKFTNAELYDWMSSILERVYRFFLQQATAMGSLAAAQLSFERQEAVPALIRPDYWDAPTGDGGTDPKGEPSPNRHGLTGSARLLQDIYQLDEFAFETDKRKLQLVRNLSLARLAPAEFQRFRETGLLRFAIPMGLFDRDFPGHYLRLIKRVRASVIALVPAVDSIKATLTCSGTSRVVIEQNNVFQRVALHRPPDMVALTGARDAAGLFDLQTQSEMLLPFEGTGVDTAWEFSLPKAANHFDFRTIADVILTVEFTALHSPAYRAQVIQSLPQTVSADQPYSFRHNLPDQWFDLHNPDKRAPVIKVRFQTRRAEFPPNLEEHKIQHVVLYFARAGGTEYKVNGLSLRFRAERPEPRDWVGGNANTIEGVVSTRRGNAASWMPMVGKSPIGEWELTLPNTEEVRELFEKGKVEDLLLVLTYSARTPQWPR